MYKKIHHFLRNSLSIAAVCLSANTFAQVSAYTFATSSGTYTPITGGTVLYTGTFDDGLSAAITIPTFLYNCSPQTSLKVNANGHIAFGTYTSSTNYTPLSGNVNASVGLVSVMGRDLSSATTGTPEVRYELVGNEFVVQWKDVRRSGTPSEVLNFQIRLNTSNQTIQFVYGSCTAGANVIYPEIGLKGINNTFATNIKNVTQSCGASGWTGVTAGTANNSTVCLSATTFPASGTTVTWTPPGGPSVPGAITGTATQCPGAANLVYSISALQGATGYAWTVPTGWTIVSGQGTTSITVNAGTTGQNGNITVSAANTCGSSNPATLAVTVGNAAPQNPGNITGNAAACPGTTNLTYSVGNTANATGYTWTVPTGWIIVSGSGTNAITVTAGTAGQNGSISVTADNSCGSSSASTIAVSVDNGTPVTPAAISGTANLCETTAPQTYNVTADPTASSYTWTVPTGWAITAGNNTNSITVTPGSVGQNGNITVSLSNNCGTSGTATLAVSNNAIPTVDAGNDTTVCSNHFPLTLTATGNATTYSWSNGSSSASTSVSTGGTYTVTATSNGCTSQDAITVVEDPCMGVKEPSLISKVYPNPVSDVLHIETQTSENHSFQVFDQNGKRVANGSLSNGQATLDISQLASGKYTLLIQQYQTSFEVIHH
jgi:hypothetical protein